MTGSHQLWPVRHHQENRSAMHAVDAQRLQAVDWRHHRSTPDWSRQHPTSISPLHHVHFSISGCASWEWEGGRMDLEPGGMYWMPANVPAGRHCPEDYEHFYLVFFYEYFPGMNLLSSFTTPGKIGEWDVETYAKLWMPERLSRCHTWQITSLVESALLAYCGEALENSIEAQTLMNSRFSNVLQYILDHLTARLRVEELSGIANMSRSAFTRAFTQTVGHSPKQHIFMLLNREASRMLLKTDLTVKEIAHHLEFKDEFHFNRFFRQLNGISPGRYRKCDVD